MSCILNHTKKTVIAEDFQPCRTFWEQTIGMMFKSRVTPLVFYFNKERRLKFHSWFCPGTIELIFLNENWEVVDTHILHKRESYTPTQPSMFVLELPPGSIKNSKTELGDIIHIIKRKPKS